MTILTASDLRIKAAAFIGGFEAPVLACPNCARIIKKVLGRCNTMAEQGMLETTYTLTDEDRECIETTDKLKTILDALEAQGFTIVTGRAQEGFHFNSPIYGNWKLVISWKA